MNWHDYFPPNTEVIALPSWASPRLYLPAERMRLRWQSSSFYPAFRPLAKLRRFLLRVGAATGLVGKRRRALSTGSVGAFVAAPLPECRTVVVLEGTPGPAQRVTVQLRDADLRVRAYLTYAEKEPAQRRLLQEYRMLERIPRHSGPAVLKYGPLGDGVGLLVEALSGSPLPIRPDLPAGAIALQRSWLLPGSYPLAAHPWVQQVVTRGEPIPEGIMEPLADRSWPAAIQHGDFAPWNLLGQTDGSVQAIDWECGTVEGFPLLDIAYYILQVAALPYRWPPQRAREYATAKLTRYGAELGLPLTTREACSIVRLAAYDAYCRSAEDGHGPEAPLQQWRQRVWVG